MGKAAATRYHAPVKLASRYRPQLHDLYEQAVQGVDYDLDLMERIYRRHHDGRRFRLLREDFCGTAALAGAWVMRRPENHAWGLDLHGPTLQWSRTHRVPRLGAAAKRLTLLQKDVRTVTRPLVDVVCAHNYSYWVFHQRRDLVDYFKHARRSLKRGGLFFITAYGGTESAGEMKEHKRVTAARSIDGEHVPPFTYYWEQELYNPIDGHLVCHIHFKFRDGSMIRRAFTYDWRMWSLPELKDALAEAGFRKSECYMEGWDYKRNVTDEIYWLRTRVENQASWLAIMVGIA